jgi:hypothetical protein
MEIFRQVRSIFEAAWAAQRVPRVQVLRAPGVVMSQFSVWIRFPYLALQAKPHCPPPDLARLELLVARDDSFKNMDADHRPAIPPPGLPPTPSFLQLRREWDSPPAPPHQLHKKTKKTKSRNKRRRSAEERPPIARVWERPSAAYDGPRDERRPSPDHRPFLPRELERGYPRPKDDRHRDGRGLPAPHSECAWDRLDHYDRGRQWDRRRPRRW